MVKLIMTWNIREGKEAEYLEFLSKDFTKLLLSMSIHPTDAWYAVWGRGPQVIAGGVAEDLAVVEKALQGEEWATLRGKLREFVVDFKYKLVEHTGSFQL